MSIVEELRSKKSRDNRELLDRAADRIEELEKAIVPTNEGKGSVKELAKDLCNKSGCHHKCHDTDGCTVEDEAREVIANSATTTAEQIEEIVAIIHHSDKNYTNIFPSSLNECLYKHGGVRTNAGIALYNAGYQKQSKGHWFIREYEFFTCSECGHDYWNGCDYTQQARERLANGDVPNYCPNCGAKMKGGE